MKSIHYLVVLLVLFSSCKNENKNEGNAKAEMASNVIKLSAEQIKNIGLETGNAEKKSISAILKVNGKIDVPPQNMVSISIPLGGFLKYTQLLPGMKVKKGETIAVMEDQQYIQIQQDFLTAKAKLGYLENEYNRQKELNISKSSSDKVFQQIEAEYKSQKVLERSLSEKLKLIHIDPEKLNESNISRTINIAAPIDGYVSAVNVNIGKYLNPSDVLFELVNPNDIHLNLTVFEKDISKLYVGQKLMAYTNNEPEKKHPCEILLIGQNLSLERSIEVHCHFLEYDKTLIPGMYMNAEIQILNQNVLTVPNDAIVSIESNNFVFVESNTNEYTLVQVQTGIDENGSTEIKSPESISNQKIVYKGAYSLLMALKNKAEE